MVIKIKFIWTLYCHFSSSKGTSTLKTINTWIFGSCIILIPWLILSIDPQLSLNRALINTCLIDTQSTPQLSLIHTWSSSPVSINTYESVDIWLTIDRLSIECQSRCWWSVYQVSTEYPLRCLECRLTKAINRHLATDAWLFIHYT